MKGTLNKKIKTGFDIVIIDAMNMIYKYNWALRNLTDNKGNKTGICYGIINFIYTLKKKYKKPKIMFVWDTKPKRKIEVDIKYKANREHTYTYDFLNQIKELRELLSLYNVDQCYADGYEADDVAAHIVKNNIGKETLLVSNDNDWFQLLEYPNVKILIGNEMFNRNMIEAKYNINVEKQCMFKSFIGEKKENVDGISRIPRKLVENIVEISYNLDDAFEFCKKNININKWYSIICNNEDKIRMNYELKKLIKEGYKIQEIQKNEDKKELLKKLKNKNMISLYEKIKNEK